MPRLQQLVNGQIFLVDVRRRWQLDSYRVVDDECAAAPRSDRNGSFRGEVKMRSIL
ncbi:MAG TPA: hypothetical protein VED37_10595 [Ktedonobacteraceae bacterium]|nr:hypothetical protein [Ktedonobacteraceae bacterium]